MSSLQRELAGLLRIRDVEGLRALLVNETAALGAQLGVGVLEVESIVGLDDAALVARLDRLVRWRRDQASARRDDELTTESTRAVLRLVDRAQFHQDGVHLDVDLLLGPVLSARASHVAFHMDDAEVAVERSLLLAARRALRPFPDLTARVDATALRLAWRRGLGGLVLRPQVVTGVQREHVLHVVLARPAVALVPPAPELMAARATVPRSRSRSWLADAIAELVLHP